VNNSKNYNKKAIAYYLNKGSRTNENQFTILTVESKVVSVERQVVKIEKPETET